MPKNWPSAEKKSARSTAQGEDAVNVLVEGLLERIAVLEERVEGFENQIAKNSRNSSKPPSGDGFKPKPKSQRRKSERSSGGQVGHPGQTLEWSSEVDAVITHLSLSESSTRRHRGVCSYRSVEEARFPRCLY